MHGGADRERGRYRRGREAQREDRERGATARKGQVMGKEGEELRKVHSDRDLQAKTSSRWLRPTSGSWRLRCCSTEVPALGLGPARVLGAPPTPCPQPPAEQGPAPWETVGGARRGGGSGDLERGLQVGPESPAAPLRVDPFAAPAQDDVDLHVDQQGDNEGHVERDDGRVHHERGVGDYALVLIWGKESRGASAARGPRAAARDLALLRG